MNSENDITPALPVPNSIHLNETVRMSLHLGFYASLPIAFLCTHTHLSLGKHFCPLSSFSLASFLKHKVPHTAVTHAYIIG